MNKTILGAALAAVSLVGLVTAAGSVAGTPAPTPKPITRAGGLAPGETHAVDGDCELGTVTCRPDRAGSCNPGNGVTTTTPPTATTTVKVLVRSPDTDTVTINSVPFLTYVENVLPKEWVPTFDGDARKAGAVAVKTYAWYWMSHFGGYVNSDPTQCFDVTDDQDFQVYQAGSADSRTTSSITQTWPVFARKAGQVFETKYRNYFHSTTEACGSYLSSYPGQMSQYGTQNCNDPDLGGNFGNKYNVILKTYYGQDIQLASTQQLRTPHDFQYLQRSTRATFRAGAWAIDDGYPTTFSLGRTGDLPVINTAGDGFARIGVFRPSNGTWYLGSPTGTVASSVAFGRSGDTPVAAQYNGLTAPTQLAVFRPSNGTWYLRGGATVAFGRSGDVPVPGRWTNSSADSIAVFRPSNGTWYLRGGATVAFGRAGDIPVPADYNGDGITDIAVFRPSNGTWYVRGGVTAAYGAKGDVPVTGDYTGDGEADLAFYRPSNHGWYVRGGSIVAFGSTGVTPIGAAPYRD